MIEQLAEIGLDALAVHRLTQLITSDYITRDYREHIIVNAYDRAHRVEALADPDRTIGELPFDDPNPPPIAQLVTCTACMSVWVALGVVVVRSRRSWRWVRLPLVWSSVTSLLPGVA